MPSTKGFLFVDADCLEDSYCIKVIEIGDWNMDSTATVTVAHGLTMSDIRFVDVMVRNDANTACYQLSSDTTPADQNGSGAGVGVDATNVNLERILGGEFNGTDFNSTSYNRGWISIMYTI